MSRKETTRFSEDSETGEKSQNLFTDYLDSIMYEWRPATKEEQIAGIDVVSIKNKIKYEVKHQTYKNKIVIEESDGLREGWIYTSESDRIVWVSEDSRNLISVKTKELRELYGKMKCMYKLHDNKRTNGVRGDSWQGTFRIIPIKDIKAYIQFSVIEVF